MFDDAPQTVSMSSDDDFLPRLELRNDGLIPVGKSPFDGQLQGLELGEFLGFGTVRVSGVFDDVVVIFVVGFHGWRRGVEGSSPDLHLLFAILGRGFGLVHASET